MLDWSGMAWIEPVTLTGTHVALEPAEPRHFGDLLAAAQDDLVWAWLPCPRPQTEDELAAMIEGERAISLPFAQIDAATGRAIGVTTYRDIDARHRTLEVGGTWLGRPWWRTPINTESKLLFLGHAFETLGANRVALKTDIRNERSQAAIARLGAVREGVLRRQYIRRDGSLRDTVIFSIVPDEWPAVKAKLQARLAAHA
jgi:RimJ/RimL family protein N-acetyltransferase